MEPQNKFLFRFLFILWSSLLVQTHTTITSRLGNQTDQLSLLEFKSLIVSGEILNMWNKSVPHCKWPGVTCGRKHHRVVALIFSGHELFGYMSPHIGNLSFLRRMDLASNKLYGGIPQQIGRLSRLRHMNLTENKFVGEIPMNISYCTELNYLSVVRNNLTGKIPMALGSLAKLVTLGLSVNKFSGEIPPSLGNLSSLQGFFVGYNNLQGSIPSELSKLTNLAIFGIGINNISGVFPSSLFNISSITVISTAVNMISGHIPTEIGFTLPNLSQFGIGGNLFTGPIPESFANASQLTRIDLSGNSFVGQVPHSLGSLQGIQHLNLGQNKLGGDPSLDLSFLKPLSNCTNLISLSFTGNNMIGKLTDSISNLSSQMLLLGMGGNEISGAIPESLGNLFNLYYLSIELNTLSGRIPSSLGRLKKLQELYLNDNQLSGKIPSSLGDISELSELDLSFNRLVGKIPQSISNCERMQFLKLSNNYFSGTIPRQIMGMASLSKGLYLSSNRLSGPLPTEIGKLTSLNALEISNNDLSGEIPIVIGNCLSLESLNLSGNSFGGTIPYALANLKGIQYLDLSQNSFHGGIPEGLENLVYLQNLNLSFNDLEGEIPTRGVFGNVSTISLAGNSKLCGGVPDLEIPLCRKTKEKKSQKLTIALVCVALFLSAVTLFGVLHWRNGKIKVSVASLEEDKLMRISYWELHSATNGFSSDNLIGSGSFGTVYKAKLDQHADKLVAVKVLNVQNGRASKSFLTECNVLRNIRHRNLVTILTYCSSMDSRLGEFKALVYEYMPNGNLEMWLHPYEESTTATLNLLQRVNIAIDVASALYYLHYDCEPPIIHCDLKPSNILLDREMCAHVGDFGLARFPANTDGVVSETSSIAVKGTIGYAAPEYGTGGEISTHGDVYAYGVFLLEMITGRRPVDDIFIDDLNLHNYVKNALPNQVLEIVDPTLHNEEQEAAVEFEVRENEAVEDIEGQKHNIIRKLQEEFEKDIITILTIALACSEESPSNRINMYHVSRELHRVKGAILANGQKRV